MQQIDDFKNKVQQEINSAQGPDSIKKQIVGGRLQELADIVQELFGLIPTLGAGEAVPTTDPGDKPVGTWYNAFTPGTYTHFDGIVMDPEEQWIIISKNESGAWSKGVVDINLSAYTKEDDFLPVKTTLEDIVSENPVNKAVDLSAGWISMTDGHLVTEAENQFAANYRTTPFIRVNDHSTVRKINVQLGGSYDADIALYSFFDADKNFLSGLHPAVELADATIRVSDYETGVSYVRVTGRQMGTDPFEVYADLVIKKESVEGLPAAIESVEKLNKDLYKDKDYAEDPLLDGYIDVAGSFVSNSAYYCTDFIEVSAGWKVKYKGITGGLVSPVAGYDQSKGFVQGLLEDGEHIAEREVTIPEGVSYVRLSARHNVGDVYSFIVPSLIVAEIDIPDTPYFTPPVAYAKEGDLFRIYPFGILAKNIDDYGVDIRWSKPNGTRDFFELTPSAADNDVAVELFTRDLFGNNKSLGTTTIKIAHAVSAPASPLNIICLGDSLTLGINSVEGAWVNEFSRRLTGTGTGQGDVQPASLGLSNIYFRGTLGDQPVKHEGRGGWSANRYLTVAAVGEVTNAFWDGAAFSLNYYLTQNNFQAAQTAGGVDATGSNLVLYILLGWNDIRIYGATDAATYIGQLVDNIHASHPDATIKLLGLNPPPASIMRSDKEDWSPELVMRDNVIAGAMAWQVIADTRAWVEFVPVAPFFSPYKAYDTVDKLINARVVDTKTYDRDNVHPVANGYAQIADVAYYNFLYNFCRTV